MSIKIKTLRRISDFVFRLARHHSVKKVTIDGTKRWTIPAHLRYSTSFTIEDAVTTSIGVDSKYVMGVMDKTIPCSPKYISTLGRIFIDLSYQLANDRDLSSQFSLGPSNQLSKVKNDKTSIKKSNIKSNGVNVNLKTLEKACNIALVYLDAFNVKKIELDYNFYWTIDSEEWLNPPTKYPEFSLGSLEDQYEYIEDILAHPEIFGTYVLESIGTLFMAIGYQLEREQETKQNKE